LLPHLDINNKNKVARQRVTWLKKMSLKFQKLVIIIMGAPGSGKGTQAELLADKLNLYYLETSKILESQIMEAKKGDYLIVEGKKYFLFNEKNNWLTGKLVNPSLVAFWIKEKIKTLAKKNQNLVLAGSPRSVEEAEKIMPLLKKLYGPENIKVILLEIAPQETIFRNSHRRICELMRHPILYSKENEKLKTCPLDGSRLIRRKGLDDPKTIKIRLKEYQEKTLPIINFLKKEKLKIYKINGSPAPAIVFKNILSRL